MVTNHFNTSNLTSTKSAFQECSSLISLDLSGWDMSKVKNMNYVFSECTSLNKIILGDVSQYDYNKIKTALDNSYLSNEVTIECTIV